ncbi:MAG TPA: hypothetical protein DDZ53_04450 [Firmicutes bacterium]|nr:hypothetical protein [Bacillota bacterium]
MSEEKMQVLRLLEKGQITYQQALALLEALGGADDPPQELIEKNVAPTAGVKTQNDAPKGQDVNADAGLAMRSVASELGQGLQNLGEQISGEVRATLQEVGSEINSALHEVGEELRDTGRENIFADFFSDIFGGNFGKQHRWQQEKQIDLDTAINSLHLAISSKNGSIRLLPTDENQVTVRMQMCLQALSEVEAKDMAVRCVEELRAVVDEQLQLAWRVNEQAVGAIAFEVLVPRRLSVEFDLSSKNGSISVADIHANGIATTKNGSIRVDGPNYGDLKLETKNGDIMASASLEALAATNKNGSISCSLEPLCEGQIALATTNGSVRAELVCREDIGYKLEMQTRSGRLIADLPNLVVDLDKQDYLRGCTSNWETVKVKSCVTATSKNGGISVRAR